MGHSKKSVAFLNAGVAGYFETCTRICQTAELVLFVSQLSCYSLRHESWNCFLCNKCYQEVDSAGSIRAPSWLSVLLWEWKVILHKFMVTSFNPPMSVATSISDSCWVQVDIEEHINHQFQLQFAFSMLWSLKTDLYADKIEMTQRMTPPHSLQEKPNGTLDPNRQTSTSALLEDTHLGNVLDLISTRKFLRHWCSFGCLCLWHEAHLICERCSERPCDI